MRIHNALFLDRNVRRGKSERTGNEYAIPLLSVFDFDSNEVYEINVADVDIEDFEETNVFGTPQQSRVHVLVTSCEARGGRLSLRGEVTPVQPQATSK